MAGEARGLRCRARCLRPGQSLTNWSTRRIRIGPGLDAPAAGRALIHELGHVLVRDRRAHLPGDSTAGCRGTQKIEADSVAFIVATRLGMDTSAYSWPYVASWAGRLQLSDASPMSVRPGSSSR